MLFLTKGGPNQCYQCIKSLPGKPWACCISGKHFFIIFFHIMDTVIPDFTLPYVRI